MRKRPSVVDLFSGAGGFARGFHEQGFLTALAIDNDKAAARSFKANFGTAIVLVEDVRNVSCDDIKYLVSNVDVVIGSPPCEPFTGANPRRKKDPLDRLYADPIGSLVLEFIRLVQCLSPKVFIMENVPGILDDGLKDALINEFAKAGFKIYFNKLWAQKYGTPSNRVRIFISNIPIKPPKVRKAPTVWEAIGDLPEPARDPIIPNHDPPPKLSPKKLKRVLRLKWDSSLITFEGAGGRAMPNLIKLHPHKIAPTVLGSSRFIHPYEPRLLTVREQARLMGFPDDHVFLGGRDEQYNQVGEAVPPTVAKAIASEVLTYLGGR
jgi:DNA (cytosine-5)-methyltransferase 1